MNIFDKPYYCLSHFNYEIYVRCPKCNGLAKVTSKQDKYGCGYDSKLNCTECFYVNGSEEWFGYYQGEVGTSDYRGYACGHCGTKMHNKTKPTKKRYDKDIFKCAQCNREKEYPIYWTKYRENLAIDPFFGLDLYYQKNIKNNTLWVYNLEHLQYLKEYLSSSIRKSERVSLRSMVAKLPRFITDKKSKDIILKTLTTFEQELIKL